MIQSFKQAANYFESNSELDKMTHEAIQILKKNAKGVPSGGSSYSCCSYHKQQKIKEFETFGLTDRIGI